MSITNTTRKTTAVTALVACLMAAVPGIGEAALVGMDDVAECSSTGAMAGQVAAALAAKTYTVAQLQTEAAKAKGNRARRLNFILDQVQAGQEAGETDPLLYASHTAALCMLGR
ncbi:hypothetical protein [Burkholderia ubonensis]|uniref:hypothetical protein n=1 Tax=Burkholderia ubonensis TaxID=101571 RepID=UPI0007539FE0|nr:hypothetical protein [Burkholderia ubonensis]KWN75022.1 hypothetical protein WM23_26740 [Burkholderia ubonensis]